MSEIKAEQNGPNKASKPKATFPEKQDIIALLDGQNCLRVRVAAGAKNDAIDLPSADAPSILSISVTALPKDGKANKAVIKLIAAALGIPKSRVTLMLGQTGRGKMVQIEAKRGAQPAEL